MDKSEIEEFSKIIAKREEIFKTILNDLKSFKENSTSISGTALDFIIDSSPQAWKDIASRISDDIKDSYSQISKFGKILDKVSSSVFLLQETIRRIYF